VIARDAQIRFIWLDRVLPPDVPVELSLHGSGRRFAGSPLPGVGGTVEDLQQRAAQLADGGLAQAAGDLSLEFGERGQGEVHRRPSLVGEFDDLGAAVIREGVTDGCLEGAGTIPPGGGRR